MAVIFLLGSVYSIAAADPPRAAARVSDFRHAPPKWQTAICLPDDPRKSLVDESGALLYHYGKGGNDFGTCVAVEVVPNAVWQK